MGNLLQAQRFPDTRHQEEQETIQPALPSRRRELILERERKFSISVESKPLRVALNWS